MLTTLSELCALHISEALFNLHALSIDSDHLF